MPEERCLRPITRWLLGWRCGWQRGDQPNMGLAVSNQDTNRCLTLWWKGSPWRCQLAGDPAVLRKPAGPHAQICEVCAWEQAPSSRWARGRPQSLVREAGKNRQQSHQWKSPRSRQGVQRVSDEGSSRDLCPQSQRPKGMWVRTWEMWEFRGRSILSPLNWGRMKVSLSREAWRWGLGWRGIQDPK